MQKTAGSVCFQPGRYAAIDIGTVTCRMLVADVDARGHIELLDREYAITNLGEKTDSTHRLLPEAIERVATTVEGYMRVLERFRQDGAPIAVRAIATSASRDAENAAEFQERLAQTGVDVQVIPGEKEAALSFKGASSEFPGERIVVVDVGGGSTEVVAGDAGANPVWAHSFNIGCRRVTEKFLHADPPREDQLNQARAWTHRQMVPYFDDLRSAGLLGGRLVAVAGTATSVVSMREQMQVYDSTRVHKAQVTRAQLQDQMMRLAAMPLSARRNVVGLDPNRAPVIVAGLGILDEVMGLGGFPSFTVSESDILQGVVLELAAK